MASKGVTALTASRNQNRVPDNYRIIISSTQAEVVKKTLNLIERPIPYQFRT